MIRAVEGDQVLAEPAATRGGQRADPFELLGDAPFLAQIVDSEAFQACEFAIDTLKVSVPIWKKEMASDGEYWVDDHA